MDKNKLKDLRDKLIKLSYMKRNRKKRNYYLTLDEKRELLREGKNIPLHVKGNGRNFKTLVKTRSPLASGDFKDRRMGL